MASISEDGLDPTRAGFFAPELDLTVASEPEAAGTPWQQWSRAIACAKAGRFEPIRSLFSLYDHPQGDPVLNRACVEVLGLAGDSWCHAQARAELVAPTKLWHYELAIDLARCLAYGGFLPDALVILEAYKRYTDIEDADAMPIFIHMMLGDGEEDEDDGPLFPDSPVDIEEYEAAVHRRYAQLVASAGREDILVLEGQPFSVRGLTEGYIAEARAKGPPSPRWRLRFEAATGIDCRTFYRRGRFQRLPALAILEEFLESPACARFIAGTRYFFGRAIP